MKKRDKEQKGWQLVVAAVILGLLVVVGSPFQAAAQTVVVGTSGQTKPLNFFSEDNQLTGFEIDVLKEMDERSDTLNFTFETDEFASLFAGLDAKKFDLVVNNLGESGDRREKYLFSLYPYIVTHNVLITAADQSDGL